jgi:uncharacterized protein YbgA (DUF1722 family)
METRQLRVADRINRLLHLIWREIRALKKSQESAVEFVDFIRRFKFAYDCHRQRARRKITVRSGEQLGTSIVIEPTTQ